LASGSRTTGCLAQIVCHPTEAVLLALGQLLQGVDNPLGLPLLALGQRWYHLRPASSRRLRNTLEQAADILATGIGRHGGIRVASLQVIRLVAELLHGHSVTLDGTLNLRHGPAIRRARCPYSGARGAESQRH